MSRVVLALALPGTLLSPLASATVIASYACDHSNVHVIAQDHQATVFYEGGLSVARFGCLRSNRRAYTLNINGGAGLDNVDSIRLVGHFAVYHDSYDDGPVLAENDIIADLQRGTGRVISSNLDPFFAGYKLAGDGALVLLKRIGMTPIQGYEIYRDDRRGLTLLDRSSAIDPRSLRLSRHAVAWIDRGVARMASLDGLDRANAFRLATRP